MKTLQRLTGPALKAGFLCGVILLLGFYVRYMHRSANPEPAPAEEDYAIDLNVEIAPSEFEGFINYGQPIQTTGISALIDSSYVDSSGKPTTVILSSKSISQPVFATRKIKTQAPVSEPEVFNGTKSPRYILPVPDLTKIWRGSADTSPPKQE
jgi:hypothetical protein